MHLVLGHLQLARAHVLVRVELDLLEAHHLRGDVHLAVAAARVVGGLLREGVEDLHLRVADGIRVVVHVDWPHIGFSFVEVQMLDMVLLALVDVDRFRMNGR